MERKEFLKSACKLGICSCAGFSFLGSQNIFAGDEKKQGEDDWKLGFIQRRFAKLISAMEKDIEPEGKQKILEAMGRECAKEFSEQLIQFKGKPEEFLASLKSKWIEDAEFNKEEKWIRMIGQKKESCGCPFIDKALTPKGFCDCSIGYIKQNYELILDKTVEVKLEKSILRGDERCNFLINF